MYGNIKTWVGYWLDHTLEVLGLKSNVNDFSNSGTNATRPRQESVLLLVIENIFNIKLP